MAALSESASGCCDLSCGKAQHNCCKCGQLGCVIICRGWPHASAAKTTGATESVGNRKFPQPLEATCCCKSFRRVETPSIVTHLQISARPGQTPFSPVSAAYDWPPGFLANSLQLTCAPAICLYTACPLSVCSIMWHSQNSIRYFDLQTALLTGNNSASIYLNNLGT